MGNPGLAAVALVHELHETRGEKRLLRLKRHGAVGNQREWPNRLFRARAPRILSVWQCGRSLSVQPTLDMSSALVDKSG